MASRPAPTPTVSSRSCWRTGQPTWPALAAGQPEAAVGGRADEPCPSCGGAVERLLRLGSVPPALALGVAALEFLWCGVCSPFVVEATFSRHDAVGKATLLPLELAIDPGSVGASEPFPKTEVGLVDLGPEWHRQDWMWSNDVENLSRLGGEPTWIQAAAVPACCRCVATARFVGQIAVADLADAEGLTYLFWCDACAISAVVYQQT